MKQVSIILDQRKEFEFAKKVRLNILYGWKCVFYAFVVFIRINNLCRFSWDCISQWMSGARDVFRFILRNKNGVTTKVYSDLIF